MSKFITVTDVEIKGNDSNKIIVNIDSIRSIRDRGDYGVIMFSKSEGVLTLESKDEIIDMIKKGC